MSRLAALSVLLAVPLFAAAPEPVPPTNPHQEAVAYYNSAERSLTAASKAHADMKATTDLQKAAAARESMKKNLEAAATDFNRAIGSDPKMFQSYSELGFTLRKLGRYDVSLAAYDKALAIEPGFPAAVEYRAEAMLGLGRLDEVKRAYMTLFTADRAKADVLMVSMNSWLAEQTLKPTVDAAQLDAFGKWVSERQTIAGQVQSAATADNFRTW